VVIRPYKLDKNSKSGTMKGWKLKVWVFKNKETIKLLITAILGLVASSLSDIVIVKLLFGAGGALGTKLILDSLDFYVSDVKIE